MGIAVPSQLWKASQQQNIALIGYSGLGLAGYGWAGLGGWAAPLAIHRDGPSSAATERTGSTASARKRGLLRLSPRPGTDGGDTVEPPLLAELLSSVRTL